MTVNVNSEQIKKEIKSILDELLTLDINNEDDIERIAYYDLKDECGDLLKFQKSDSILVKFLKYKKETQRKYKKMIFDCDSCLLITVIYYILFDYLMEGVIVPKSFKGTNRYDRFLIMLNSNNKASFYFGDTMTSAWLPYLKSNIQKKARKILDGKKVPQYKCNYEYENVGQWAEYLLKNNFENVDSDVEKCLCTVHTIGNMIPVPELFNINRVKSTGDRWDKTLLYIYNWYQSGDENELKILLNNHRVAVEKCINWLNIFGSWDNFVKFNYLEDYVKDICFEELKEIDLEELAEKTLLRGKRMIRELICRLQSHLEYCPHCGTYYDNGDFSTSPFCSNCTD